MKKWVPRFQWIFVGHSIDSTSFMIDEIDVWKHEWKRTNEPNAKVKDPAYKQDFEFHVYEIDTGTKTIRFAAGEFSNCVYGFYTMKDYGA